MLTFRQKDCSINNSGAVRKLTVTLLLLVFSLLTALATDITSLDQIDNPSGNYTITGNINASGFSTIASFTGTLTAAIDPVTNSPYIISNLSCPLFTTATDATISNIMLKGVSISQGGYVGAICGTANGATRIYNCGILPTTNDASSTSTIGSNNSYCGSLVGFLDGTARVINCFSYANITAGTVRAGIVGYNNYSSKYNDQRTMVMNCMFYGDISDGGTIYPVFGGQDINNYTSGGKLNTYNYYLYEAPFSKNKKITATSNTDQHYNHALAAEEKYLIRFEYYRYLLNSTRELAAWYATGNPANGNSASASNKMLKWVLDKSIAKYPILKVQDSNTSGTYPSVINYDPEYTYDETGTKIARTSSTLERNQGKNLGTLNVTISMPNTPTGGQGKPNGASLTTTSLTLQRTDKDYNNYNFNYDKVQLPYYNEVGSGNCTHNKVVTGWMITNIDAVSNDPYTSSHYTGTNYDAPYYNFADRASSNKDKYSVSGRVFSQGAYFDVPDGVSSITIEPYWGNAAYLSDEYYDCCVKNGTYSGTQIYNCESVNITGSKRYTNGNDYSINGDDQTVYTSMANAVTSLGSGTGIVYDNAVVLVGNYHLCSSPSLDKLSYTIMSADLNNDNEPDYSFIFRSSKQEKTDPIRFDFINVPGMAMAHKVYENDDMAVPGNIKSRGWFEITNTCLIRFAQFEYDSEEKKKNEPLILLGGEFKQLVSTNGNDDNNKHTTYIHLGSNVYFPNMFSNGCHMDRKKTATPHRPISVTGGDYNEFYLTGNLQPNTKATTDNAECYISGGRFGDVAGAAQEQLNGNVNWFIDHADIENFYGGGINEKNPITGNITTVIKNSYVNKIFCGGPKFGDMSKAGNMNICGNEGAKNVSVSISSNRTVSTTATNCHFGTFFGAGYGGTSLFRENVYNEYQNYLEDHPWNNQVASNYDGSRGQYANGKGIRTGYDYRLFEGTRPRTIGLLFIQYASLSLATTNDVTSNLKDCTMENFYGGGSLGKVDGDIVSTLEDCTINGSVYGAGFSAQPPTADIFPTGGFDPIPKYSKYTGVFDEGIAPTPVKYTWSNDKTPSNNNVAIEDIGSEHLIYVAKADKDLSDLGTVTGKITLNLKGGTTVTGNVFGGGDESSLTGNADVNVGDINIPGNLTISGKVFGGGNNAVTGGKDTKVTLTSGTVTGGIYGGCNINGNITGNTTVLLNGGVVGTAGNTTNNIAFGGGYGENTSTDGNVTLTVNGSTIHGNVYGGSALGNVNGSNKTTTVTLTTGTVNGSIYGGGLGDANHAALVNGNVQVTVDGGTIGGDVYGCNNVNGAPQGTVTVDINATDTPQSGYAITKVFGGGNQAAYIGTPVVRIHDCDNKIHYVYGGGNQASVTGTNVTVYGGSDIGYVFGGGYGADVTHDGTQVNIYGGNIGYLFGGNDHSGTVNGDINVEIQEQAEANHQLCALTIGQVYGGGQLADASGSVTVNVRKSVITGDVYGGGALANTNTGNLNNDQTITTDRNITEVNLYPQATIYGDVYGGGRGQKAAQNQNPVQAIVYGDVSVYQLGAVLVPVITDGLAASGRIFGCNNANGTPKGHVLVYIERTTKNSNTDDYALSAVYGGGNEAEYVPFSIGQDRSESTEVLIDGCNDITIYSVYGGGNAASTPATSVTISGAQEIMYVYGGGNGAGEGNPGANVGYHDYSESQYTGTTQADIDGRTQEFAYGTGIASTNIYGGNIHYVYGGSNTKGNIRQASVAMLDELSTCPLTIDGIYGGGREAYMEGSTSLELGCTKGMPEIYGGSENADVGSDIVLTLTSGHYDKVFGGNNKGGRILGSITVNIEQTGCLPITIDELYLGGNNAPYSVYGYESTSKQVALNGESITHYDLKESGSTRFHDPLLHLRSFQSIGTVFGGGNGAYATMVADPTVEINVTKGWVNGLYGGLDQEYNQYKNTPQEMASDGVIGTVYGGGNEAKVIGSTNILIGDSLSELATIRSMSQLYKAIPQEGLIRGNIKMVKADNAGVKTITYTVIDQNGDPEPGKEPLTVNIKETVNGATITGNVYGGGNNAHVTQSTNIQVGPNP